jgi:hypothetical protein
MWVWAEGTRGKEYPSRDCWAKEGGEAVHRTSASTTRTRKNRDVFSVKGFEENDKRITSSFSLPLNPVVDTPSLLLPKGLLDLSQKFIKIFDQSVMVHQHLTADRRQQRGRYDRLFQCIIDLPLFVGKNRKGYLQPSFIVIGSCLVVRNGYPQDPDVLG